MNDEAPSRLDELSKDSTYSVRRASAEDLSAVLSVLAENQPSRPSDWRANTVRPSEQQTAMWDRVTRTPDVTVYVAEWEGQAVGTACRLVLPHITYNCRPSAFIEAVTVRYGHRRRGVARLMLRRALDDARHDGCFKIQLLTHKRHACDGAHDLYRSLGFAREAEGFRLYLDAHP